MELRPQVKWLMLACACGACGPQPKPPDAAESAQVVETFLVHELQGNAAKAWALMASCDVDQSSETTFVVLRANQLARVVSHDTALVIVDYDALGDLLPAGRKASAGMFTFRPRARRIGETFSVTWDSAGRPALACGVHHANHIQIAGFRREQFTVADGSRARWDSVKAAQ